jgi:hypothetical protein
MNPKTKGYYFLQMLAVELLHYLAHTVINNAVIQCNSKQFRIIHAIQFNSQ